MSSKAGRRRRQGQRVARPSPFFLIALGIGLLLLIVMVVQVVRTPMTPPATNSPASR